MSINASNGLLTPSVSITGVRVGPAIPGPTGPAGPAGPTGPIGPTGPASP